MPDYKKIGFEYKEYKGVHLGIVFDKKDWEDLQKIVNNFVRYQDRNYQFDKGVFDNIESNYEEILKDNIRNQLVALEIKEDQYFNYLSLFW